MLASLSSCAKGPDVRIVLCQDLAVNVLNSRAENIKWTEEKINHKQYDEAEIILSYEQDKNSEQISCYYPYTADVDADLGDELIDALSIYSTYPSKVKLKDKSISGDKLAKLVNQVMLMQGKAVLTKIKNSGKKE